MNRIVTLNRVFTAFIFTVVASLTIYGYVSLVVDSRVGAVVQREFGLYDAYRTLEVNDLGSEIRANISWAAQPDRTTWRAAAGAQRAFDAELGKLQREARGSDKAWVREISSQHTAIVGVAWRVMHLVASHHDREAQSIYNARVLTPYAALGNRIDALSRRHRVSADLLSARWSALEHSLEAAMIAAGVLGLVLLMALTCTMHEYRKRADEAIGREIERLERAALSDSLTSLGNHRAFRDDLLKEISRSRRHDQALTLALIDVDDFKALNDTHGHAHGDAVLVETARALQTGRREDRAYRIGGDEFAMLLIETNLERAQHVIARLHERLRARLNGATVSVGLCELNDGIDESDLYERADAALYAAKRNGRDTTVNFASIRRHTTIVPVRKCVALQSLLEQRALDVAFQPIWSMGRKAVLGFEALARPSQSLGLAGPQEAFDVAERQRRVADLDRLCIERALERVAELPQAHLLFLNVTPETLGRADFSARGLVEEARAFGLEPQRIVVELTERHITDSRSIALAVQELRRVGFAVALDDTGSGSAGLEILRRVAFDFVKIDRSVIAEAMTHRRASGVLAGIVAIARASGSLVVAEGIENAEQLAFISRFQSTSSDAIGGVQGYLLGRPQHTVPDAAEIAALRQILCENTAAGESIAS